MVCTVNLITGTLRKFGFLTGDPSVRYMHPSDFQNPRSLDPFIHSKYSSVRSDIFL